VKNTHHSQGEVRRVPVDSELVVMSDIVKEPGVLRTSYGRDMEFHLDPANPGEILRIDQPFTPLAVALEEVATPGHTDKIPQRPGGNNGMCAVPFNIHGTSPAECPLDYPDGNTIQADILLQNRGGDRLDRDHVPAFPGRTDTKGTCIRPDIKDDILLEDIIEIILLDPGNQAAGACRKDETGTVRGNDIISRAKIPASSPEYSPFHPPPLSRISTF
jgi:hypothetical protein